MIAVALPDGQEVDFPDGTDPEIIRAKMAQLHAASRETPAPGHRDMSQLGADIGAAGGLRAVGHVAPPPDPGIISEGAGALESAIGVPIAGAMEMARDFGQAHPIAKLSPLVALAQYTKPGITQEETQDAAARRQAYLDAHPDDAHAALAFGTEMGANLLPVGPAAWAGGGAGMLARAAIPAALRAAAPALTEAAAGALGGAASGAGLGYVSSYGLTPEQRLEAAKTGALVGGAGGALGGIHGAIKGARAQEAATQLPQQPPAAPPPDLTPVADQYLAARDQAAQAAQQAMPQILQAAQESLQAAGPGETPPGMPPEVLAAARGQGDPQAAVQAIVEHAQKVVDQQWHEPLAQLAAQQPDPQIHGAADATQAAAAPEVQAPPYQRVESPVEQRLRSASPLAGPGIEWGNYTNRDAETQLTLNPGVIYRAGEVPSARPLTWFAGGTKEKALDYTGSYAKMQGGGTISSADASGLRLATAADLPGVETPRGGPLSPAAEASFADVLRAKGFDGFVQHEADVPTYGILPEAIGKLGRGGEAGFLKLGRGNMPPANVDPFEAVVRHGEDPASQQSGPGFLKRAGDRAYQEFVNAQQPPLTLLRRAGLTDEAHQIELLQARSRGASAIAQGPIERGTYAFDPTTGNNTRTGDGFAAYLSGLDSGALKDVNDFMAAQHHMELAGRQQAAEQARAQWLPTLKAAGVKADVDAMLAQTKDAELAINPEGTRLAQAKLAELQQRYGVDPTGRVNQLQDVAEGVRDVSKRGVLDPLKEVGYISQEEYDRIAAKNQQYAPFFRLIDDVSKDTVLQQGGTQGKPVKLISGGLDPDKPIAPPLESFVMQAQRVGAWVERQRVRNQLADVADANPQTVGQEIYSTRRGPLGMAARDSFQVFRNGQRFDYSAPKPVLDAVNGLPAGPASLLMQAAQVAARLKRAGVVVTPEFAASHAVRFQFDATGFGSGEAAAGKKFSYTPVDFFRGLMEMTPQGKKLGGYYDAWKQAGGAMAHINASDRALAEATVQDIAGVGGLGGRILRNWQAEQNVFAKVLAPVLYPLEGTTRFLDTATRVGAFRKAKLAGASDLEAGAFSRDLLDYSRMGSVGRQVNGVHAFFNPDIQATDRFVRAMRDQPVATTLKGLSYMTLPAIANWYRWHEDKDYQNLPAWEHQVYLHLWKRDDGSFVRIPRPLGLLNLAFSYGVHNALDHLYGQDPDATHNLAVALTDLTPIHNANPMTWFSIAQPAIETMAGPGGYSNFTGRPIVPQGLQGELTEDRQLDSTSAIASRVGGALGIAPLKIDYLIQGYGGTAGRVATNNPVTNGILGKEDLPPLPVRAHDLPLIGRFVDAPAVGWGSDPVSKFYALSDSANQATASLKVAAEGGDARRYQQILKQHPEALLEPTLTSTRADLAALRKTRQEIRKMEGLTPQQRYDALLSIDQAATAMAGGMMHGAADYLRGTQ